MEADGERPNDYTKLTAEVVAAYVSNNAVELAALPDIIATVAEAFRIGITPREEAASVPKPVPAVPVKKSVTDEFIICLEDGKRFKSMRRHLKTHYGMTPADYCAKWDLPPDYPMVAPAYTVARSALAKAFGLGGHRRKAAAAKAAPEPAAEPAPKRRAPRKAKEAT